jgi:hypothetical protein
MDYAEPNFTDFGNVRSLNQQFLRCLRTDDGGLLQALPSAWQAAAAGLTDLHLERLAGCPLLLFSLSYADSELWSRLSRNERNADWLQESPSPGGVTQLVTATIGFLWHLSQRDAHVARLIAGATPGWCERLADADLFRLVHNASLTPRLLSPRVVQGSDIWARLLGEGLSSDRATRTAAHLSVLHSTLAGEQLHQRRPLRSAACENAIPVRKLAAGKRGA